MPFLRLWNIFIANGKRLEMNFMFAHYLETLTAHILNKAWSKSSLGTPQNLVPPSLKYMPSVRSIAWSYPKYMSCLFIQAQTKNNSQYWLDQTRFNLLVSEIVNDMAFQNILLHPAYKKLNDKKLQNCSQYNACVRKP